MEKGAFFLHYNFVSPFLSALQNVFLFTKLAGSPWLYISICLTDIYDILLFSLSNSGKKNKRCVKLVANKKMKIKKLMTWLNHDVWNSSWNLLLNTIIRFSLLINCVFILTSVHVGKKIKYQDLQNYNNESTHNDIQFQLNRTRRGFLLAKEKNHLQMLQVL